MSADDDLPYAMQSFSRQGSSTPLTAADTERLLDGHGAPREAPAVQHAIAGLLDSAAGPPKDQELAGEVTAVAAFVQATGERAARSARFRARARPGQAIAAGIAAAVVVAFSGAAAADALPAPIQELAHRTFGAPAPRPSAPLPKATVPSATPAPAASPGSRHGKAKALGKKASPKASAHSTAKGNGNGNGNGKGKGKAVPPGHQKG
jgi:hypothetical protein